MDLSTGNISLSMKGFIYPFRAAWRLSDHNPGGPYRRPWAATSGPQSIAARHGANYTHQRTSGP